MKTTKTLLFVFILLFNLKHSIGQYGLEWFDQFNFENLKISVGTGMISPSYGKEIIRMYTYEGITKVYPKMPVFIKLESQQEKNLSYAIEFGYSNLKANTTAFMYNYFGDTVKENITSSIQRYSLTFTTTHYFQPLKKVETYYSYGGGLKWVYFEKEGRLTGSYSEKLGFPIEYIIFFPIMISEMGADGFQFLPISIVLRGGAKYAITEKLGVYAEAGIGHGIFKTGLTYKF